MLRLFRRQGPGLSAGSRGDGNPQLFLRLHADPQHLLPWLPRPVVRPPFRHVQHQRIVLRRQDLLRRRQRLIPRVLVLLVHLLRHVDAVAAVQFPFPGRPAPLSLLRRAQPQQQAVLPPAPPDKAGFVSVRLRVHRADLSRLCVIVFDPPASLERHPVAFLPVRRSRFPGLRVAEKNVPALSVLPHGVQQILRRPAPVRQDPDLPRGLQGLVQPDPVPGQPCALPAEVLRLFAVRRVHVSRRASQEDHQPALLPEIPQRFQRRPAHRLHARHDHRVVGHLSHAEARRPGPILIRQPALADVVKVQLVLQHPPGQFLKFPVQLLPFHPRQVIGSPGNPAALNRMEDADPDQRLSPGHQGVHPGEVILDKRVLLPPGALVSDGSRIVPLALPVHADPVQVGHPHCHPQRRLPVSLQLVTLEVEVPVRHAIQLAGHPRASLLVGGGSRLLHRDEFPPVAQLIHPRQGEGPVGPHDLAHRAGLSRQGALAHHVAGHQDAVLPAPVADLVAERAHKPLRRVIVKPVPRQGDALRQLPYQLRQPVQQALSVPGPVAFLQVSRPGHQHVLPVSGSAQRGFPRHLGLVRKDGRAQGPQILSQRLRVPVMGNPDKIPDRGGIHGVRVSVEMEPGRRPGYFFHRVPGFSRLPGLPAILPVRQPPVARQPARAVQPHPVSGQQPAFSFRRSLGGKEQIPLPVFLLFRHITPRKPGGPFVLVIQPGQHVPLPGLLHAGPDSLHKVIAQIGHGHPAPDVHMEAPHTHLLHHADFPPQQLLVQIIVPCPEGRAAVFSPGMPEKLRIHPLLQPARIKHCLVSFPAILTNQIYFCPKGVWGAERPENATVWRFQ